MGLKIINWQYKGMTPEQVRDSLMALPDGDRQIVISRPSSGQKEVVAIQQSNDGKIECECIDTPIP